MCVRERGILKEKTTDLGKELVLCRTETALTLLVDGGTERGTVGLPVLGAFGLNKMDY